jgi:hypothetical protein
VLLAVMIRIKDEGIIEAKDKESKDTWKTMR